MSVGDSFRHDVSNISVEISSIVCVKVGMRSVNLPRKYPAVNELVVIHVKAMLASLKP